MTRSILDNSRDRQKPTEAQIRQMQSFLCTGSDRCDECGVPIKIVTSLEDTPTGLRFTNNAGESRRMCFACYDTLSQQVAV